MGRTETGLTSDTSAQIVGIGNIAFSRHHYPRTVPELGTLILIGTGLAMRRRSQGRHHRIDALVDNTGVTRRANVLDLTEADWDRSTRL